MCLLYVSVMSLRSFSKSSMSNFTQRKTRSLKLVNAANHLVLQSLLPKLIGARGVKELQ